MTSFRSLIRPACFLLAYLAWACQAWSQDGDQNREVSVNYVYAAQLGIGTYDIGGLSVDVFSLPLSITRPLPDGLVKNLPVDNAEDWEWRFKFPPSFGVFNFDQTDPDFGQIDITQYTLAVVPGIELIAPVTDNWRLKPFVDFGIGKTIASSGEGGGDKNFFAVYSGGLRSLVEWPIGDFRLGLGNGAIFAGNRDFGSAAEENYLAIETGLQLRRSLGFSLADMDIDSESIKDAEPEVGVYFIHYYYPKALEFSRFLEEPLKVRNQFEIGLTLGSATEWEFLSILNPQIGASYIFGDDLTVFRINFGFPF